MRESKKYKALRSARSYWNIPDQYTKRSPEIIQLYAKTGIFTHMELAKLIGVSPAMVRNATRGMDLPRYKFGDKFDPNTIDSMLLLMEHYDAWGKVPRGVIDLITPHTSLSVVSRMTGIGVTELAYAEPLFP